MNDQIKEIVSRAAKKTLLDIEMPGFDVSYADEKFGDYSTNAALILGKKVGKPAAEIAKGIVKELRASEIVETAEVAGPGFINLKMTLPYWQEKISKILILGENYGRSDLGKDLKVNIEFISANPTGPLTVGNSRGGVIGDVLASVYEKAGFRVTREYYFNDAGGQIDILGHSILKDAEAQYKGGYIDELAKEINGNDAREVGRKAAQKIITDIKKTTAKMGINFDVWSAEGKDLRDKGKIADIIKWLNEKKLTYNKEGALWFKSTQYGDDKDRVLIRSNGEPTYFAVDCAYHKDKFVTRNFDLVIDVWGADHHGDVARIKGFAEAMGFIDKFKIVIHQFVRVLKDGQEVRMSKRSGNYILVDDLLREIGKDVYRFFMLEYAPNSHLTFDLGLAKERTQKNPVFYVQYAYARCSSILRKSQNINTKSQINTNLDNLNLLKQPEEISLIKEIAKLPELVEIMLKDSEVQKLPTYACILAGKFHNFYEKCSVIKNDDKKLSSARLELIKATKIVLKNTLDLMGISAPEKM